ncbi:DUF3037 domain-containing protein [Demetria terragena]|uniref:DUF3037 domain-containing protein n=1 Tax=Demetria terragena TaxID=63959 RepID=UPI0003821A85|nr:DUF3037 domain-containing protein [Demetria terragena]
MTDAPLGYQYVTIRLVPDVAREEFINIAVVLYCQSADFLDADYVLDARRWSALSGAIEAAEVERSLDVIRMVCAGEPLPGLPDLGRPGQRFGWIAAPRSTVLQPGPVHGGTTDGPAAELARLTDCLVR